MDTGDIFNIGIPPTEDEYSIDTYLLIIGNKDITSMNDASGLKYIINWYEGVYSIME